MLTDGEISESHPLAEVCKRVPKGIVCLLSALRFHGLTTQQPHEVWLALDGKARQPRVDHLALQIVRSSGEALRAGQKEHLIEGVSVKIYCPALEALRETWKEKRCTMDELMRYARICRVANVIRPYLESLSYCVGADTAVDGEGEPFDLVSRDTGSSGCCIREPSHSRI